MLKQQQRLFLIFSVIFVGCLVQKSSAVVGLSEVLDIIKVAKDMVVTIAKAWNIVDQHVDFSEIPIPLLDRTESKLFERIGIISAKLDKLGHDVDAVEFELNKRSSVSLTLTITGITSKNDRFSMFKNEILTNRQNLRRKVGEKFRQYYKIIHNILNRVEHFVDKTNSNTLGTTTIALVLQNLPDKVRLELRLNDLLDYITRIDINYRHFQNYVKYQKGIERLTLEDFAKHVISHDSNSISSLVERIHAFIVPNGRGITNTGLLKFLRKSLELAYADLRGIYALYETFRRFQKQQTAPGRIPSPKRAWTDLAETILYDPKSSVETSMNRTYYMVMKNMFQNAKKEVEGDMLCNSQQSPQQVLLNLYNAIALTELKGYTMIQFSYMLLRLYDQGNFTKETQLMRERYQERTNSAVETVRNVMKNASRELWNCDPKKHVKGETYEEITQLLQGYVQNEIDLNSEGTCRENCAEYIYTEKKHKQSFEDESMVVSYRKQKHCSGKIIDCKFFDSNMWICPASPPSNRRYEYIEYENGRILGRKLQEGCPRSTIKVDSWKYMHIFWQCSYCFCLCNQQNINSDIYINMRPAIADILNNRVITGLRFVKKNRILHLQIQEGELLPRGKINVDTVHWVPVEEYKIGDRKIYNAQDFHTLSWEKRALDLDDLEAGESYILTGVRFKQIGTHLNFEIFVTRFDFDSGKLVNPGATSVWKDNSNTDSSPQNPRIKVTLSHPDIPIRSPSPSIPTSKSDQYIEFTHSDIDRDAAQTTVPFIDAQKVESLQAVPLSGAGIFHKGRNNFGGFITPKIITYDFSKHLKAAFPGEKIN